MSQVKYTVVIYTPQELNHASYIQTGLYELENLGFIELQVKLITALHTGRLVVDDNKVKKTKQANPKTSYYKLINQQTKKEILFATDLYDFANQFSDHALQHCDFVFKRSFEKRYVEKLPASHQNKLHKLGMSFGVRSDYSRNKTLFCTGLFLTNLRLKVKVNRLFFKELIKTYKALLQHWKFINSTRQLHRFEVYNNPKKESVFFQTRCFLHERDTDVKQIHVQRYSLIKLLRAKFPKLFLGGFVSSKIAELNYKDAITNVPSEPELYLDALKDAKIVIYTRGLANSPAWKMAEYCSQAKVIIAERLTTDLPVPLVHGKEVLFFDTDEELVANIKRVLSDKNLAENLSKNARAYFEEHIHPAQNVKRILEFMMANESN